jgi:hypothetical protein
MPQSPLNFHTSEERSRWIIAHADCYTTFVIINREKYGDTYKTLAQAKKAAHAACGIIHKPVMIYAVAHSDLAAGAKTTWVKTIKPAGVPDGQQGSEG